MARSPLTPARRARLEKLAAYLEGLPKGYRHFDMRTYLAGADTGEAVAKYARRNGGVASCGTAACAAGHGPAAGVPVPPSFFDRWGDPDWEGYCTLFVGEFDWDNGQPSARLYRWLFGGEWRRVDNHHWGAAARIRYVLATGAPPAMYDATTPGSPPQSMRRLYAPYRLDAKATPDA